MSMLSEQVKRLREMSKNYPINIEINVFQQTLAEAADTIEALSTKLQAANMERSDRYYNGGWILCSDRLPENNGKYLVTYADDIVDNYVIVRNFYNGRFEPMPYSEENLGRKAIAWMPLPEPYKPD